jgi:large subunit ribosomal protein L23
VLNVIKKPLISEKLTALAETGIYGFEVDKKATKTEIKAIFEKNFDVKVESVKTIVCRGRSKRTTHGATKPKYWKKALIKLKPGEKISLFEGA